MKQQSGRASLMTILAVLALALILVMLFAGRESLGSIGGRFMNALQRGDVDTLTKMSYLGKDSPEEIRKQWDFAVNKAGKYYVFLYRVISHKQFGPDSGSVRVQVLRNADSPAAYEEFFELPMVRVGDEWKVDVKAISRDMYPALPR